MNFGNFKAKVKELVTVDGNRLGLSGGGVDVVDTKTRLALADLQSHIVALRANQKTVLEFSQVDANGEASSGDLNIGGPIREAYYVKKNCPCFQNPFTPYPWEHRFELICGKPRLVHRQYLLAIDPYATEFIIYPALIDGAQLWLFSDSKKTDFNDLDEGNFDLEEAEAAAHYVKSYVQLEVEKDVTLFNAFFGLYVKARQKLFVDWKLRAEMAAPRPSPRPADMCTLNTCPNLTPTDLVGENLSVPERPTHLRLQVTGGTVLEWNDNSDNEDVFAVQRRAAESSDPFVDVALVGAGITVLDFGVFGTLFAAQVDIPVGVDAFSVTGMAWPTVPASIFGVTVIKPAGGQNLTATVVAGSATTDGFGVELSGVSVSGYKLAFSYMFTPSIASVEFPIPNGVDSFQVTGMGWPSLPAAVIGLTVKKNAGASQLFALEVSGTRTTDGFNVELNGVTDSADYKLEFGVTFNPSSGFEYQVVARNDQGDSLPSNILSV